jgi:hypothetical protein
MLDPEDSAALGVEYLLLDECVDAPSWCKGGVQLDERMGPEKSVSNLSIDLIPDPWVSDVHKAAGIRSVLRNDMPV